MRLQQLFLVVLIAFSAACSSDNEENTKVQSSIEKFLKDKEIEYTGTSGVYKRTFYTEYDRESGAIFNGDSIWIYYGIYLFDAGNNKGTGTLYDTNIESYFKSCVQDSSLLSSDSLGIKVGAENILNVVEKKLVGSHVNDSILIYLSPDNAYGDTYIGTIPKNKAITFLVVINKKKVPQTAEPETES